MTGENLEGDEAEEKGSEYQVGDNVVVKPVNKRCTSRWVEGVVTGIVSRSNVEVDGVPRHVLDIRRLVRSGDGGGNTAPGEPPNPGAGGGDPTADENGPRVLREESSDDETSDNEEEEEDQPREWVEVARPRRSTRTRRHPAYLDDYEW